MAAQRAERALPTLAPVWTIDEETMRESFVDASTPAGAPATEPSRSFDHGECPHPDPDKVSYHRSEEPYGVKLLCHTR